MVSNSRKVAVMSHNVGVLIFLGVLFCNFVAFGCFPCCCSEIRTGCFHSLYLFQKLIPASGFTTETEIQHSHYSLVWLSMWGSLRHVECWTGQGKLPKAHLCGANCRLWAHTCLYISRWYMVSAITNSMAFYHHKVCFFPSVIMGLFDMHNVNLINHKKADCDDFEWHFLSFLVLIKVIF